MHHYSSILLAALSLSCSVPVATSLDESDANRAVVLLEQGGVGAQKERDAESEGRFRVTVQQGEASAAIGLLSQENLPPRTSPGVLEALGEGSVVPSRLAEHAKWIAGIGGDLERSLRTIDGVLSARVHLAVPAKEGLGSESEPVQPSASVLVRHRGATPPLPPQEVQRLVAGAVAGLSPLHVNVVMASNPAARPAERELRHFGPITVTQGSAAVLRWAVGGAVLLNLLLVGCLALIWNRWRRSELSLLEVRSGATAEPQR
ncbi:MAG TPA: hypothetical protein VER33_11095 [Polyangiaceae bacterium]|nr:hypothetical protein [Polyangiaceae bacterium]